VPYTASKAVAEHASVGPAIYVAPAFPGARRISSDDDRLCGLPNVGEIARFKLFASRTVSFVTGDVNVATDVAGRGQGTLAQANLWFTVPFDPTFSVSVGPTGSVNIGRVDRLSVQVRA
jgi:hypothetical protein